MRRFARLYDRLDSTTSTNAKTARLREYFESAPPADAAWAVYFLTGRRFDRPVTTSQLRQWTYALADVPEWLFEECYIKVGDLAETIALLLDVVGEAEAEAVPLHVWAEERLSALERMSEERQRETITGWWRRLDRMGIFILNKLMMGGMRVGVSSGLVTRALAEVGGVDRPTIQHRLAGNWEPSAAFFESLISEEAADADVSRPYPYFLATPVAQKSEPLTDEDLAEWFVEWKWDGIRAQLVKRDGGVYLWSRGHELITPSYPEIRDAGQLIAPSVVLDGELLAWRDGEPLPFELLQRRIGRKRPGRTIRREVPVVLMAFDLLERGGEDVREQSFEQRRRQLEAVCADSPDRIRLSPAVEESSWEAYEERRDGAREQNLEGLMIKRRSSPYRAGRVRGDWWKWKVDPLTVDAVMIYAKVGHGRRADLYTDLTFAVWDDDELVPICKAYSGLTDDEIAELDDWIKDHTRERYGPVRSVEPAHVFEIHFAGLSPSNRHKSGLALRFPRIARWRRELAPGEADDLAYMEALLDDHYEVPEEDEPEQQTLF